MWNCDVFSYGDVLNDDYLDIVFPFLSDQDPVNVSDYLFGCCDLRIDYINSVIDRLSYEKRCLIDYQQKL